MTQVPDHDASRRPRVDARACPGCGHGASRTVGAKDGFDWVQCRRCATRFVTAVPSSAEQLDYFASYGRTADEVPAIVSTRSREIVAGLERHRRTGRLLEIGFGSGVMLGEAAAMGWDCWGVEVSETALAAVQGRGWTTFHGEVTALALPEGSFDVVLLIETVEHLARPGDYLRHVARLLRPGGAVFGTTPNGASLTSRLLGLKWSVFCAPDHLQLFTRRGLGALLAASELTPVEIRAEGVNPTVVRGALPGGRGSSPDRVGSAYALNARLTSSARGRLAKRAVNCLLSPTGLGDSLKFLAHRPGS